MLSTNIFSSAGEISVMFTDRCIIIFRVLANFLKIFCSVCRAENSGFELQIRTKKKKDKKKLEMFKISFNFYFHTYSLLKTDS